MTSTKKTNEQCMLAPLILHEPIKYLASAKARGAGGGGRCGGYICYTSASRGALRPHHSLDTMQAGMVSDPEAGRKDVVS